MKTGTKGIELIKYFESLHDGDLTKIGLQPKMCPAGIWTVGYGHALKDSDGTWLKGEGEKYKIHHLYPELETITEEQAEKILKVDLGLFEHLVENNLRVAVIQNQFDALVSHAFNCGISETLYRLINSKSGIEQVKNWWTTKYITSNGKALKGLKIRREKEFELFTQTI